MLSYTTTNIIENHTYNILESRGKNELINSTPVACRPHSSNVLGFPFDPFYYSGESFVFGFRIEINRSGIKRGGATENHKRSIPPHFRGHKET